MLIETASTTNDGVIVYSLDNVDWSTELPTVINAGDYTVYYKAQGDDNHEDSEGSHLSSQT